MVSCIYLGVTGHDLQKYVENYFLEEQFVIANSEDPDEMLHFLAFHLGLHCKSTHLLFVCLICLN